MEELRGVEKRIASLFVVNKKLNKIIRPTQECYKDIGRHGHTCPIDCKRKIIFAVGNNPTYTRGLRGKYQKGPIKQGNGDDIGIPQTENRSES